MPHRVYMITLEAGDRGDRIDAVRFVFNLDSLAIEQARRWLIRRIDVDETRPFTASLRRVDGSSTTSLGAWRISQGADPSWTSDVTSR